jgi:hypothetical protein
MGVDWLGCRNCGETFPDCGDFTSCECGEHWCCDECAEEDGYKRSSCKLGYDIEDNECEKSCYDCDDFMETSCKYCREEDFEDYELLEFALKALNMSRNDLIEAYKLSKEK